jgi:hypothetical protein
VILSLLLDDHFGRRGSPAIPDADDHIDAYELESSVD